MKYIVLLNFFIPTIERYPPVTMIAFVVFILCLSLVLGCSLLFYKKYLYFFKKHMIQGSIYLNLIIIFFLANAHTYSILPEIQIPYGGFLIIPVIAFYILFIFIMLIFSGFIYSRAKTEKVQDVTQNTNILSSSQGRLALPVFIAIVLTGLIFAASWSNLKIYYFDNIIATLFAIFICSTVAISYLLMKIKNINVYLLINKIILYGLCLTLAIDIYNFCDFVFSILYKNNSSINFGFSFVTSILLLVIEVILIYFLKKKSMIANALIALIFVIQFGGMVRIIDGRFLASKINFIYFLFQYGIIAIFSLNIAIPVLMNKSSLKDIGFTK